MIRKLFLLKLFLIFLYFNITAKQIIIEIILINN